MVEEKIYAYRLTSDTGFAPCIFDRDRKSTELLTLACCMEKLRHTIGKHYASEVDAGQARIYVMGTYNDRLLYFAKITKIVSMKDYFAENSPYKNRLDNIYDVLSDGSLTRNANPIKVHCETEELESDSSGKFVLISDCFAYWGVESKEIPQNLQKILPRGIGHLPYSSDSPEGKQIKDWVSGLWNFKDIIQNEPNDELPGIAGCCCAN